MKSVVQIQRQGKVKDVRALAAAAGLIDSTVALIQALPLGLQAVGEALDTEVTALAGTRYCRREDVPAWSAGDSNQAQSTSPIRSCPSRSLASVIESRTERSR